MGMFERHGLRRANENPRTPVTNVQGYGSRLAVDTTTGKTTRIESTNTPQGSYFSAPQGYSLSTGGTGGRDFFLTPLKKQSGLRAPPVGAPQPQVDTTSLIRNKRNPVTSVIQDYKPFGG